MKKIIFSLCLLFANSAFSMLRNSDQDNSLEFLKNSTVSYIIDSQIPNVIYSEDRFRRYVTAKIFLINKYDNIPASYFKDNVRVFDVLPQNSCLLYFTLKNGDIISPYWDIPSNSENLKQLITSFVNKYK